MTLPVIKTATESDEIYVLDTLKLAFVSDPAFRWVWPDPQQYLSHVSNFAKAFAGKAFLHGTASYVGNYYGVALWLPPSIYPDVDVMVDLLQKTGSEGSKRDSPEVFEKMGSYHPSEPHWYLPLLGVDPFYQGKGFGSMLMEHATAMFDKDNGLAYLESSNPRNVSLYKRHGFEVLGTIQVNSSPPIFPMLRKPRKPW